MENELISNLLECIPEIAMVIDSDGLIHAPNSTAISHFGIQKKQIENKSFRNFFILTEEQYSFVINSLKQDKTCSIETVARRKDASRFWVDVIFSKFNNHDKKRFYFIVCK